MKDGNPTLDPELLLAQSAWVEALARRLISDPERAEDAAQEVLATAVAHPPARITAEPYLRAWLARVLRNFVVTSRRRDGRRRLREERAARPERQDSAAAIVARAEEHRIVVETVLALDEPYRTALLLRFFGGCDAMQLADKMDCTPEAARKRVSRGLVRMRRALDERHGGNRGSWQRGLVVLVGTRSWKTGIWASLGRIMVVSTKAKSLVGAMVVLMGAVLLWRSIGEGGPVEPGTVDPGGGRANVAGVQVELRGATGESAGRAEVDPLAPAGPRALRVRDGRTGSPLPGVRVSWARPAAWAELRADLEKCWEALDITDRAARWTRLAGAEELAPVPGTTGVAPFVPRDETAVGTSDADGFLGLDFTPVAGTGFVFRLGGYFPAFLPADTLLAGEDILDLALLPAGRLDVLVVDPNGRPVSDAHVRIERSYDPMPPSAFGLPLAPLLDEVCWHGPTDAEGRVVVDPLPSGLPLFVAVLGEFQSSPPYEPQIYIDPLAPTASLVIEVSFVGSIEGMVLDLDENPLEGVVLWYVEPDVPSLTGGARTHPAVTTDAWGRYRFEDAVVGTGEVWVVDPLQYVRSKKPVDVSPGACTSLEPFFLGPCVGILGHLVSETPFDPDRILVRIRDGDNGSYSHEPRSSKSFRFEVPRGEYVVEVTGMFGVGPLAVQRVDAPCRDVEIRLDGLLGGVTASIEDGERVDRIRRVRFYVKGDDGRGELNAHNGERTYGDVPLTGGVFLCLSLAPGEYAMVVDGGELGGAWIPTVRVRADEITDLGRIAFGRAVLRGKVTDGSGSPIPGARVSIKAPGLSVWDPEPPWEREATTDADGLYTIPSIRPTTWVVHAETVDGRCSERRLVPLTAGKEERLDLELHDSARIRGRVLSHGEPVVGVEVFVGSGAMPVDDYARVRMQGGWSRRSDAEGAFELGPFLPGTYRIFARTKPYRLRRITLQAGEVAVADFVLDSESTRLRFPADERLSGRVGLVSVHGLDPSSPFHAEKRRARRLPGNEFEVDLFPSLSFLTATNGPHATYWYAVLDGASGEDVIEVVFPTGVVEVPVSDECAHMPPLRLILVAVPEGDVWAATGTNWTLPRDDSDAGVLRFLGVPDGARLRLEGIDRAGRDFVRELVYMGPGPLRVDWP